MASTASRVASLFRDTIQTRTYNSNQAGRQNRRVDPVRLAVANLSDDDIVSMIGEEATRSGAIVVSSNLEGMPCSVCAFADDSVMMLYPETMKAEVLHPGSRKTWALEQVQETTNGC